MIAKLFQRIGGRRAARSAAAAPEADADRSAMLLGIIDLLIKRADVETAVAVIEVMRRLGLHPLDDHRRRTEPGAAAGAAAGATPDRARYRLD
jgi:hypothetical protein